jgi:hypothetical protein
VAAEERVNRWYARFALANGIALALTGVAVLQPWVDAGGGIPSAIARVYVPISLVLAALATALVARILPAERRGAFLARHFAVYAVVPALLFVQSRTLEPSPAVLGAIYLLAFALWSWHALEGLWHVIANLGDRTAALLIAAVVLVPFLALLPYERAVMPTASDEPHYLILMQSLAGDHDFELSDEYDNIAAYQAFYDGPLAARHVINVGESQYPIHDVGMPVVAALPFALGGRTGVLVLMCFVGAALVAQLYRACRDLHIAHRPALLAVSAAALAHPLLSYTTQVYPELIAGLAFVTAARLLRGGRATSLAQLAGASACVGVLPWLSTRAWLIAVGVGLVVAYCALRPAGRLDVAVLARRIAAGAFPFAALVLLLAYLNYRMFGWFMPSANYYLISDQQQVLAFTPQIGGLGLPFDRVFGLIPRTPLFLVSAIGLIPLLRRARTAELAALALGWLVYFLYIADIAYWWADGSPPSRYLLAALPFLVVLLAAGIERLSELRVASNAGVAIAWALAAYSLFVSYVYAVLPNTRYDLASDIKASGSEGALFAFLGRVLRPDPAIAFPSLVDAHVSDLLLGSAWLVVVVALIVVGASNLYRDERLNA